MNGECTMKSTVKDKATQDWAVFDAMTDEQRRAAALSDPDSQPTLEGTKAHRVRDWPISRAVRHQLRLTQVKFAERYRIPLGTLRDWDQGRSKPDAASLVLLESIRKFPDEIAGVAASVEAV